jgi:hypothetical protein
MDEYQSADSPCIEGNPTLIPRRDALKIQRQGTLADGSFQPQEINLSLLAWLAAKHGAKDRKAIKADDTKKKACLRNSFRRLYRTRMNSV